MEGCFVSLITMGVCVCVFVHTCIVTTFCCTDVTLKGCLASVYITLSGYHTSEISKLLCVCVCVCVCMHVLYMCVHL